MYLVCRKLYFRCVYFLTLVICSVILTLMLGSGSEVQPCEPTTGQESGCTKVHHAPMLWSQFSSLGTGNEFLAYNEFRSGRNPSVS